MEESEEYLIYIASLISRYLQNDLEIREVEELERWVGADERNADRFRSLLNEAGIERLGVVFRSAGIDDALTRAKDGLEFSKVGEAPVKRLHASSRRLWTRIGVAAAVATIVFGAGLFYYTNQNLKSDSAAAVVQDVAPGKEGATLRLANGNAIQLSDSKTGIVINHNKIVYNDNTPLSAQGGTLPKEVNGIVQMLTATTAKGQTYQFQLPDGTNVWLNADSKISFPSQFTGKNRKIVLSGEGYFEVAKDKTHPFIVSTTKQDVEVLGTHFNINSYTDESATKTGLLEGSVKINNRTIIKPGEQASSNGPDDVKVTPVDVDKVVAWKNGRFVFESESIESIMRKLSRWYNVEVIYQDDVKDIPFTAFISRRDNISKILEKITYTQNIHFKIEGRRITIMK
jgi:transmembrane sensor